MKVYKNILMIIISFSSFSECFCSTMPPPNREPFLKQIGFGFTQYYNLTNNINKDLGLYNYIISNNISNYNFSLNYDQRVSRIKIPKFLDRISLSYEYYKLNSQINYENFVFEKEIKNDFINISTSKDLFFIELTHDVFKNLEDIYLNMIFNLNFGIGLNPNVSYKGSNNNKLQNVLKDLDLNANNVLKTNYKLGFGVFVENNFLFVFKIWKNKINRLYIYLSPYYGFEVEYFNNSYISKNLNYKFRIGINILPYYYD